MDRVLIVLLVIINERQLYYWDKSAKNKVNGIYELNLKKFQPNIYQNYVLIAFSLLQLSIRKLRPTITNFRKIYRCKSNSI